MYGSIFKCQWVFGGKCEKYKFYKVFEGFCLFYSNLANTKLSTIKEGKNVKVRQRSR